MTLPKNIIDEASTNIDSFNEARKVFGVALEKFQNEIQELRASKSVKDAALDAHNETWDILKKTQEYSQLEKILGVLFKDLKNFKDESVEKVFILKGLKYTKKGTADFIRSDNEEDVVFERLKSESGYQSYTPQFRALKDTPEYKEYKDTYDKLEFLTGRKSIGGWFVVEILSKMVV